MNYLLHRDDGPVPLDNARRPTRRATWPLWVAGLVSLGLVMSGCCKCPEDGQGGGRSKASDGREKSQVKAGLPNKTAVESLNETCADVWCEGAYDFWFHEISCSRKKKRCKVGFTARIPDYEWERLGRKLPKKRAKKPMETRWRVGGKAPVYDDVTWNDLPSVLVDDTWTFPLSAFERSGGRWYLSESGFERVSKKVDGWTPPGG